jgi:hypothetical protein
MPPDGVTLEGQRTARDLLIEGMSTQGLEEVPCVEFTFNDGAVVDVMTDSNPSLRRPASDVRSMKFKSSAEAGSVVLTSLLMRATIAKIYA